MSRTRQRIQNRGIFTPQHRRPKSTLEWHSYQLLSSAEKRKEHRGEIVVFESFQDRATQTHATEIDEFLNDLGQRDTEHSIVHSPFLEYGGVDESDEEQKLFGIKKYLNRTSASPQEHRQNLGVGC
jgi:hypothetical protein